MEIVLKKHLNLISQTEFEFESTKSQIKGIENAYISQDDIALEVEKTYPVFYKKWFK